MVGICFAASCRHAEGAGRNPEAAQAQTQQAGNSDGGVFAKLDLGLRRAMGDKTGGDLRAVAQLDRPLPSQVIEELRQGGLRILSIGPERAFVEGDAHALMKLAVRAEVTRMHASKPLKPLPKE